MPFDLVGWSGGRGTNQKLKPSRGRHTQFGPCGELIVKERLPES